GRWREEARKLEPAVAIGRAHHRNLDALIGESSDASRPFSFDKGPPFELESELAEEIDRLSEVVDDDSYVIHPFDRHVSNLQGVVEFNSGSLLQYRRTNATRILKDRSNSHYSGRITRYTEKTQRALDISMAVTAGRVSSRCSR